MARIAGIDLPREKRIEIGLTYIYGIGRTSAQKILEMTGINPDIRVKDLTEDQEAALRDVIDKHFTIEGEIPKRQVMHQWRFAVVYRTSQQSIKAGGPGDFGYT